MEHHELDHIFKNLTTLEKSTKCTSSFLDLVVRKGILQGAERHVIESMPTERKKTEEFYRLLLQQEISNKLQDGKTRLEGPMEPCVLYKTARGKLVANANQMECLYSSHYGFSEDRSPPCQPVKLLAANKNKSTTDSQGSTDTTSRWSNPASTSQVESFTEYTKSASERVPLNNTQEPNRLITIDDREQQSFSKHQRITLMYIVVGVLLFALIPLSIVANQAKHDTNNHPGLVAEMELLVVKNHEEFQGIERTQECNKDLSIRFESLHYGDWPQAFEIPCPQKVLSVQICGYMLASTFQFIINGYNWSQSIIIENDVVLYGDTASTSVVNLVNLKSLFVYCEISTKVYRILFGYFTFPSLKTVHMEGYLIDNTSSKLIQTFLKKARKLQELSIHGVFATFTDIFPESILPSVRVLNMTLEFANHREYFNETGFHFCHILTHLTHLKSTQWTLPIHSLDSCLSLEQIDLIIPNDYGAIVSDMTYFADYLPSLSAVELVFTHTSVRTCPNYTLANWELVKERPSLRKFTVQSQICPIENGMYHIYWVK